MGDSRSPKVNRQPKSKEMNLQGTSQSATTLIDEFYDKIIHNLTRLLPPTDLRLTDLGEGYKTGIEEAIARVNFTKMETELFPKKDNTHDKSIGNPPPASGSTGTNDCSTCPLWINENEKIE